MTGKKPWENDEFDDLVIINNARKALGIKSGDPFSPKQLREAKRDPKVRQAFDNVAQRRASRQVGATAAAKPNLPGAKGSPWRVVLWLLAAAFFFAAFCVGVLGVTGQSGSDALASIVFAGFLAFFGVCILLLSRVLPDRE
ncbi:hypothetical protein SAMN05892883_2860 [Jatrophihabitans sp. GAS493]|uniref:hypothetical protein n=1 Tax=Jatrophihabitans sp. GAS493 TaxID=1907575 RepID=UPI000BBF550B|nr:hypothetical protein [Jatrophihabitans sp. GAS493]SOD73566.1 hypothetical protein SAMN05892883_2860 [Jatrophihabitans sp. GAS493]